MSEATQTADTGSRYDQRGVSASKEEVHAAIKNLDQGLFPKAFSKVYPDLLSGSDEHCLLMSSDGSGSKASLAYIYWKETGDLSVWKGIAQDVIVMNLDDIACCGLDGHILFSSVINRNKNVIPGEVISAIISGTQDFFDQMNDHGIPITYAGGETADLGDLVRTITVDGSMVARMLRSQVISCDRIQAGDVIVGLASDGQATYEDCHNFGMGSNGLTSARHDVLNAIYREKYPESFDAAIDENLVYSGTKYLTDFFEGTDIGKAILSPTRTYAPVIKKVLNQCSAVNGIVHCTGGAQTKVLHFIENLRVVKDNLFAPPPLFKLIQSESGTDWKEMYKVFNMGHRLEFYLPQHEAQTVIDIASEFGIAAQIIGRVEAAEKPEVVVQTEMGKFCY